MPKTDITEELYQYCLDKGVREHPELTKLRNATRSISNHHMLISQEHGAFMAMITKLIKATSYLEIGVFTGYSTLWVALALPENGKITALDISNEHSELAKNAWKNAGVLHKIDYKIDPAINSLQELIKLNAVYDLIFIDANKSQYPEYYELSLQLLPQNGLLIIDNVFMHGQILEKEPKHNYINKLKQLNEHIRNDERVDICMLPFGDGITMARKKIARY